MQTAQERRGHERMAGALVEIEDLTFRVLRNCVSIVRTSHPDQSECGTLFDPIPSLHNDEDASASL
jgi:hypothetical protein